MPNPAQDTNKLLLVIIAIFLPPVAVLLVKGLGMHFVINLILTILIPWLGGFLHALWCILKD